MNKDTIAGSVKEAGGKIRETVGHPLGDHKGEALGTKDKWEGKAHKVLGKAKDAIKEFND